MKNIITAILIASMAIVVLTTPLRAQIVTMNEALTVADNWITFITYNKSSWGDYETAGVIEITEFRSDQRLLGYVCSVEPAGFIIVSLHRGLAPIKAYSTSGYIDPTATEGLVAMLKMTMRGSLDIIQEKCGPMESVRPVDLRALTSVDHEPTWLALLADVKSFAASLDSQVITMDYVEGQELLTSDWHQRPPFNDDYDWEDMLDGYYWDSTQSRFEDQDGGSGSPCSQAQIDAVAELCAEVGEAAGTNYGCGDSSAWYSDRPFGADLVHALEDHFRYHSDLDFDARWNDGDESWHNKIMADLDQNRPIPYSITDITGIATFPSHAMVVHGWKIVGSAFMCCINYGWVGTGDDIWYQIDILPDSDLEGMIVGVRPNVSLGSLIFGTYNRNASFPYRYFDQNASGIYATFESGQNLQFLPGVTLSCTSTTGDYIGFEGTSSNNTCLFSILGSSNGGVEAEIQIQDGEIRLYEDGSIKFH